MAINRFDKPAQAEFMNTYVPIPFQELAQAAKMRQGKHDQNIAAIDASRIAADRLLAIPNSKDEVYVNNLRSQLDELSTRYSGEDLSDPNIYRELRMKMRAIADPNKINKVTQSYAGYQNYKKSAAQLESSGRGQHPSLQKNFTNYDSFDDEQGIFDEMPTMGHNWNSQMEDFFNHVELIDGGVRDVEGAPGFKQTMLTRSASRLKQYARDNVGNFMNTPAGREMAKVAMATGVNPEEYIQEQLQRVAPTFERSHPGQPFYTQRKDPNASGGSGDTSMWMTSQMAGAGDGKKQRGDADFYGFGNIPKISFEKDGSISKDAESSGIGPQDDMDHMGIPAGLGPAGRFGGESTRPEDISPESRNRAIIGKIEEAFPKLADLPTDKAKYDAYTQISADMFAHRSARMDISDEQARAWKAGLGRDLVHRSVADEYGKVSKATDTGKKSVWGKNGYSMKEIMDELNDPTSDKIQVSGFALGNSPIDGAFEIQVMDKNRRGPGGKNELRSMYISSNTEFSEVMKPLGDVHKLIMSGENGMVDAGWNSNGENIGIKVKTNIFQDRNGNWHYEPQLQRGVKGEDGEFITDEGYEPDDMTFSEMADESILYLRQSNYLGSELGDVGSPSKVR